MYTPTAGRETHLALWERILFGRAYEAHECRGAVAGIDVAPDLLARAYQRCAEITASASRTFYMASGLLPAQKRQAARALYAFCRVSDDLVDRPAGPGCMGLAEWRAHVLAKRVPVDDPVALAWLDTRTRYHIPECLIDQFFDGVDADLHRNRYGSFEDLAEYAYGVASTVGLMVMHIIGFDGPSAIPYAVKLGVALQITNILRDVGEDWRNGRLYLPQAELASYDLSEADIAAGKVDERWQAFMQFQIERNRRLYSEAEPGIGMLHRDGRLAIQAASDLYAAILDDIEAHGGDVFSRRAHLSGLGKVRRLPGIWLRARRASAHRIRAI